MKSPNLRTASIEYQIKRHFTPNPGGINAYLLASSFTGQPLVSTSPCQGILKETTARKLIQLIACLPNVTLRYIADHDLGYTYTQFWFSCGSVQFKIQELAIRQREHHIQVLKKLEEIGETLVKACNGAILVDLPHKRRPPLMMDDVTLLSLVILG